MTADEVEAKATAIILGLTAKLNPVEQAYGNWLLTRKRAVEGNTPANPAFPALRQQAADAHEHLCKTVEDYRE